MDTDGQATSNENAAQDTAQDWLFDAFCQPRTIPDNWDLSEASNTARSNGTHRPVTTSQPPAAEDAAEGENLHIYYLNPFPEPRTYPVYWDLI